MPSKQNGLGTGYDGDAIAQEVSAYAEKFIMQLNCCLFSQVSVHAVVIVAVGWLSVARADDLADERAAAEIQAVFDEFDAAFRHLDWDRLRQTFADDATMFFPSSRTSKRLNGIDEIKKVMEPMFEGNKDRRAARGIKAPEEQPASALDLKIQRYGDTAIMTFQPEAALGRQRTLIRRTLVLRKNGGKWLIVHLHGSNTELPENEP